MWTTTSGLRGKKLHYAITFTSVVGFSLFGYDQGLMSGILQGTSFTGEFPVLDKNLPGNNPEHVSVLQGAVTACYELGCFFGAIFTLCFGQRTGRTPLLITGGALMVVGTVISTAAYGESWGLGQFVIGRVVFRSWKRYGHCHYPCLAV